MATTLTKRRNAKAAQKPVGAMVDTPIYFCIAVDDDGESYVYSAESDRDALSMPSRDVEHYVVKADIAFRFVRPEIPEISCIINGPRFARG